MSESLESRCRYGASAWLWYVLDPVFESAAKVTLESHAGSCKECADRLNFYRELATIMDLNGAAPPESWVEEAVAQFRIIGRWI